MAATKTLSKENIEIVRQNWQTMSAVSAEYDVNNFVSVPLLKLVPEGRPQVGRPPYLPAPHEVAQRAYLDFTGQSPLGDLKIGERYGSSLQVVFSGFLLAVVIGVPVALLAGTFGFFSRLTEPFVDFFRYMPAPAFSTVLMAVFGLAQAPKMALVFLGLLAVGTFLDYFVQLIFILPVFWTHSARGFQTVAWLINSTMEKLIKSNRTSRF